MLPINDPCFFRENSMVHHLSSKKCEVTSDLSIKKSKKLFFYYLCSSVFLDPPGPSVVLSFPDKSIPNKKLY